ncbi:MAG: rhodanese-like domain-containing protein, partial [Dietzia sp.]|nr:rhodanese-like domain-containing protein [Dietzia sp.]
MEGRVLRWLRPMMMICSRRAAEARSRISEAPAERVLQFSREKLTLIDVRGEDEYAQGHIAGAVNLPLDQLAERIKGELPDKGALVVCYCNGGNRGALAADALQQI